MIAAAHGMLAAFQDYPQLVRDEAVVEARAQDLADLRVRIWPALSNDQRMYLRLFVPACVWLFLWSDNERGSLWTTQDHVASEGLFSPSS